MKFHIRDANADDSEAMLALLPRLADFEFPAHRQARHFWQHDAELLARWVAGDAEQCFVQVAVRDDRVLGLTLTTLRPEALSDEPSAHLEVIAVAAEAEGQGIAKALLGAAEARARERGAQSMTLHVIASNGRARGFYEHSGYMGEMLRYIKPLGG